MDRPLIELQKLHARNEHGDFVFTDLEFTLEPGRSAIITGAPGSGKTTIAELLVARQFAAEGTVNVFGESIRRGKTGRIRRIRRKIGGVGGPYGLIPSLTVSENIMLPLIVAGERPKAQKERCLKILSEFTLLKIAAKYPSSLTRVENTLVQFARASIANQPLMIIDEPSAGLDSGTYLQVCEFLVKASLAGRSMLILAWEPPPKEIPNSAMYKIADGKLE
jgi:ABC-type ATPase involved in cell division